MTDINVREIENKYIMQTYKRLPVTMVRGMGTSLFDEDGKEYLDLISGLGVTNIGHCHPKVVEATARQAGELVHVSNLFYTQPQAELAKKLCEISIGQRVFFANSGAEANEGAFKIARKYAKLKGNKDKINIISAFRGFHGRTLASLAATGQPEKQEFFMPMPAGFNYGIFNNTGSFAELIDDDTCAVILEIIQGEAGVHVAEKTFINQVAEMCANRDALLIIDEVQTGLGRTGKMFAYEHFDLKPDIVTVAKGLANGLPIGVVIAGEKAANVLEPSDHGSTFGGGPVVCAAANAVMDVLAGDGLVKAAAKKGEIARQKLQELAAINDIVSEVRGMGLMLAVELRKERANEVVTAGLDNGIILNATGPATIRLLPPLTITQEKLLYGLDVLGQLLENIK